MNADRGRKRDSNPGSFLSWVFNHAVNSVEMLSPSIKWAYIPAFCGENDPNADALWVSVGGSKTCHLGLIKGLGLDEFRNFGIQPLHLDFPILARLADRRGRRGVVALDRGHLPAIPCFWEFAAPKDDEFEHGS